ncbi:MAG: nuclear transport factor 2 family protein [Thermomicrobiales bacterium]|nr:nuclear transport factor 2 family protein [Thermomicrobiales bacterium]
MEPTPREVAESYWRAECRRDMDAILAHYHPDAEFRPAGAMLRGHDEIRTFYQDSIDRFPGLECTILHEVSHGNEASLEWQALLIDHDGVRHPLVGVNVVRVSGGKFVSVHAYFDQSTFYGDR